MCMCFRLLFFVSKNYKKEMLKNNIYEIKLSETFCKYETFFQHLKAPNSGNCVFRNNFEEFVLLN